MEPGKPILCFTKYTNHPGSTPEGQGLAADGLPVWLGPLWEHLHALLVELTSDDQSTPGKMLQRCHRCQTSQEVQSKTPQAHLTCDHYPKSYREMPALVLLHRSAEWGDWRTFRLCSRAWGGAGERVSTTAEARS